MRSLDLVTETGKSVLRTTMMEELDLADVDDGLSEESLAYGLNPLPLL